jgi:predicted nucleic acid-binding protein
MRYALDTNAVILLLREDQHICRKFDAAVERGDDFIIPPLVHYEIRRGFLCKSAPRREKMYDRLIKQYPVDEVSVESLELGAGVYADLYHAKRTVSDVDLLIAAYCMDGGYTLITNNVRHFEVIDGLKFENWAE